MGRIRDVSKKLRVLSGVRPSSTKLTPLTVLKRDVCAMPIPKLPDQVRIVRHKKVEMHFNRGIAGAPDAAVAAPKTRRQGALW